jgi:hypothetical protein
VIAMVTKRIVGGLSNQIRNNFKNYLRDFATSIVRTRKTETKDSMERITAESTADVTYAADIQWITKYDLANMNLGNVQEGDGMIFVEYSADIELHDLITFSSKTYIVVKEIEGEQISGDITYRGFSIKLY